MIMEGSFPVVYPSTKDIILSQLNLQKIMTSVAFINSEQKKQNVHEIINFNKLIFLDCGIFQRGSYKKYDTWGKICKYREKLIDWYAHLKPDLASSLDLPSLHIFKDKIRKERLTWSIENYKLMKTQLDVPLVLGISVFSIEDIYLTKNYIQKILGEEPVLIGLGGLVPLMRSCKTHPALGKLILKIVYQTRKNFPHSFIHVYGLGDHQWYPLTRLVGASSSDYAGYYYITGRGGILLPNSSEKYVLRMIKQKTKKGFVYYTRSNNKIFSIKELRQLYGCRCPSCKDSDPTLLEFDRKKRLVHNLYTILSETRIVDEYCNQNDIERLKKYVKDRFTHGKNEMKAYVKYALELVEK